MSSFVSVAVVLFCLFPYCLRQSLLVSSYQEEAIRHSLVRSWADKLGTELFIVGEYITRRKDVQESYKQAQVVTRDGKKLVEEIAREISKMFELKVSAVKRISESAEETAISETDVPMENYTYYNAKTIYEPGTTPTEDPLLDSLMDKVDKKDITVPLEMALTPNPHFYNIPINLTYSAVHVPTTVFDRNVEVLKSIKWSEKLDRIFVNNLRADPTLSWQYFGSSTGFMRQYPAMLWPSDTVDVYDCRIRSWYIEAATSPKDVIVLVDNSGSMMGERKHIARHVVNNILDTLTSNDFVNVFTFSDIIQEVVPCFHNVLVQANLANIRELKLGMEKINSTNIANVSAALITALELLEDYRNDRQAARCNQAIMLITDGITQNFDTIFEHYNWRDPSYKPVRIFTYLIGKEVADITSVKAMACDNQGYYVHLSTQAEVLEDVLQYIPVMARPLVLKRYDHPTIWTQVYADIIDPKFTEWQWETNECEEQRERFLSMRKNKLFFFSDAEQDRRYRMKQKRIQIQEQGDISKYRMMTSVSIPVFDRRQNATRIAALLGVAGTDVPIEDIQKLMMPHMLGVNGYAFIVTNNGYILIHPDLRPVFQGILKPNYNSVDMAEVELVDDDRRPRDFNPSLLAFRNEVINQTTGAKWLSVKYHFDAMKRVSRIRRQYYWMGIKDTPFTLVATIPEPYGLHRLQIRSDEEIHRVHAKGTYSVKYFNGSHWMIHPDWLYCRHVEKTFPTPESELLYFLERMSQPGWRWPLNKTPTPPEHAVMYSNVSGGKSDKLEKDSYFCDRNLIQNLVFDARVTEWFSQNISNSQKEDKGKEFIERFGVMVAFMATHSGLTRWQNLCTDEPKLEPEDPEPEEEVTTEKPTLEDDIPRRFNGYDPSGHDFSKLYKRAIDEIWYKRAVEQYILDPGSYVYSVPFESGDRNDTLVTASSAVYHSEGENKAPAAVVGFQFHHSALAAVFKNITSTCGESVNCAKTCTSEDLDCYILDNNGYVMASETPADTGRFFGEVRTQLMHRLIVERVYRPIQIVDYQAVCFRPKSQKDATNFGNILRTPLTYLWRTLRLFFSSIFWYFVQIFAHPTEAYGFPNQEEALYSDDDSPVTDPTFSAEPLTSTKETPKEEYDAKVLINRTRPQACDREVTLYQLQTHTPEKTRNPNPYKMPAKACERPFVVQPIQYSNLILLVVDAICNDELTSVSGLQSPSPVLLHASPKEVDYNGTLSCYKVKAPELYRKRPVSCINKHENESLITLCGKATPTTASNILLSLLGVYIFTILVLT